MLRIFLIKLIVFYCVLGVLVNFAEGTILSNQNQTSNGTTEASQVLQGKVNGTSNDTITGLDLEHPNHKRKKVTEPKTNETAILEKKQDKQLSSLLPISTASPIPTINASPLANVVINNLQGLRFTLINPLVAGFNLTNSTASVRIPYRRVVPLELVGSFLTITGPLTAVKSQYSGTSVTLTLPIRIPPLTLIPGASATFLFSVTFGDSWDSTSFVIVGVATLGPDSYGNTVSLLVPLTRSYYESSVTLVVPLVHHVSPIFDFLRTSIFLSIPLFAKPKTNSSTKASLVTSFVVPPLAPLPSVLPAALGIPSGFIFPRPLPDWGAYIASPPVLRP